MTTPIPDDEKTRLKGLAVRLREIQTGAIAEPAERRRAFLREEIGRSLASMPNEDRKRCLEELLAHFPSGEQPVKERPSAAVEENRPAPASPKTPEEELDSFLSAAVGIAEDRRLALAKRLAEAGFNWVDRDQLLLEIADNLREGLGLPSGQQPRLARMLQLNLLLIDLLNRLDHMALKTFSELAPRSGLSSRPQEFREAVANFLTGNSDSVEPQIRAVSALLGGLLAAMLAAGREFGRQYNERFAPGSIEDVVKGEGKVKLFGNEKALCWDKYKDLARDYATPELVDRRIKDCLGAFAEKKILAAR